MVDGVGQEHENGAGASEEKERPPVRLSRLGQRPSSAAIVGTVTCPSGWARARQGGAPKGGSPTEGPPERMFRQCRPRIAAGRVPWQGGLGGRRGRAGAGGRRG